MVRNTGASLGIGFVYHNAAGLVIPDGRTLYIWERPSQMEPTEYVVTNLQGGLVLTAVVAVVVGIGVVLFAKRDLH